MKIIPFKKKGKTYHLQDEIILAYDQHGVQVMGSGVRIFITEKSGKLIIKLPDVTAKLKVNPKGREFILSKNRKVREEL